MSRQVIPASVKRTLIWFCAGAGAILPGYTFFTTFPPPIFPGISILTSVLSAAMIYITLNIKSVTSHGEATNRQLDSEGVTPTVCSILQLGGIRSVA